MAGHEPTRSTRDESGITLVMAIVVMLVVTALGFTSLRFAESNARSGELSSGGDEAHDLAEAGIAEALAILNQPNVNVLSKDLLPKHATPRTSTYAGGTVRWHGELDESTAPKRWVITATGSVENPTGPTAANLERTVEAVVPIQVGTDAALASDAWGYIYSGATGDPSGCDVTLDNAVVMQSPLYVAGNLCLDNTGTITGGPLIVHGQLTLKKSHSKVGTLADPIVRAEIGYGCIYWRNPLHDPCSSADNVFADTIVDLPTDVDPPTVFWDWAYLHASPGPYSGCSTASGAVPVFDNDQGSPISPNPAKRNRSMMGSFLLTPAASYTCKTAGGELSWNATTKKLSVDGVVFIDGNAKMDVTEVIDYDGRGAIYLSGSFLLKNGAMCAEVNVDGDDCDWAGWEPSTEDMIVFVTNGTGGQTEVDSDATAEVKSASLQGAIYGTVNVTLGTTARFQGPIIANEAITGQTVEYITFPSPTIVPIGTPGQPEEYATLGRPAIYG